MKAIFKLAFAFAALLSFAACSDVPMPYEQPGNNPKGDEPSTETYLDESFSSDFGKFTNVTVKGNAWAIDYQTAKATGYDNNSKKTTESEAYLVSSPINLSKSTAAHLQFEYILRYVKEGQTENKVLITDNYTGDPTTTTWTDISGTMTEGSDWTIFSTYKKNIPTSFIGKSSVVVAMMYSCTTTSSTIEVKNLTLKEGTVDEGGNTPETPSDALNTPETAWTVAEAIKKIEANGGEALNGEAYVKGIISSVDYYNDTYKSLSYYISDNGTSNNTLQIYSGKGINGADFNSKEDLKAGQTVVVKGILKAFNGKNEMDKNNTLISVSEGGSTPDTPSTGEAVTINGTTVTLTNKAATAGTETTTIDLNTLGLENGKAVTEITFPDGTKLKFDKGTGTTAPAFYEKTKGIRVYLNNTLTFAASKKIAKIEFTCDKYGSTPYVGNVAATVTFSSDGAVYTNSDPNAEKGGVQLRVQTITITYAK